MKQIVSIQSWTKPFVHTDGVAVVFDIFRCTTTVHCLHSRKPQKLFVGKSLKELREENVSVVKDCNVFSELSQEIDCKARFDNSPHFALTSPAPTQALVATTTGTPAMFAARNFRKVYLGSFVNFSVLLRTLAKLDEPITLIPAAPFDWQHVEDDIAAQSVATALAGFVDMPDFLRKTAESGTEQIRKSHRVPALLKKLPTAKEDIAICLDVDRFDFVLSCDFQNAPDPLLAVVRQEA